MRPPRVRPATGRLLIRHEEGDTQPPPPSRFRGIAAALPLRRPPRFRRIAGREVWLEEQQEEGRMVKSRPKPTPVNAAVEMVFNPSVSGARNPRHDGALSSSSGERHNFMGSNLSHMYQKPAVEESDGTSDEEPAIDDAKLWKDVELVGEEGSGGDNKKGGGDEGGHNGRWWRDDDEGSRPDVSDGSRAGMILNRGVILDLMYDYYGEALDALPLEDMPKLAPCLLDAGVCFGFADPVTNIIANTVCFLPNKDGKPELEGRARKRKRKAKGNASGEARMREGILSKIAAGDVPNFPPRPVEVRTIAERSLEGLIVFLTSYFRYLPTWVTLRYLRLAQADLLVAVRLIERDRCYHRKDKFCIRSEATKIAMKCAALSARQPNVDSFLAGSFSVVSQLDLISNIVRADSHCRLSIQEICWLSDLVMNPVKFRNSRNLMKLADLRLHTHTLRELPAPTESLRGVLLDRVHAIYLKAVCKIPMEYFNQYHQSLLKAGYCYGPFHPVSNIIINTIWYDTVFPAPPELKLDMVCTPVSARLESQSLDGLIKLLLACIHDISEHDAMVYLLKSNLKLKKSFRMARIEGRETSGLDISAYKTAADATCHPKPEAYVQFAVQCLPAIRSVVKSLLQDSKTLSSNEIIHLSNHFSPPKCKPAKSLESHELTDEALEMLSSYKENFFTQQCFVRRKVESALENYGQIKGYAYKLRVIYGLNESVGTKKSFRDLKNPYSHVNFWASLKDGTNTTLFFAEFSNHNDEETLCCPVFDLSTNVRCCYCEFQGIRIVHPSKSYHGGAIDFEKMAWRKHEMTNARIISHGNLMTCPGGIIGEDYIYFNPSQDATFIRAMNQSALTANLDWGEEIRKAKLMDRKRDRRPVDQRKISGLTAVAIWDLADDVEYEHVKKLFQEVNDVVSISFSSIKHVATVEFSTEQSAEMAIFKLSGCHLMGRLLKFAWFEKDRYNPDRDMLPPIETLHSKMKKTVCVEGFDSSLNLEKIRCMLNAHFIRCMKMRFPTNPDGISTGRVYITLSDQTGLCKALERDGSDMGGHKLRVSKWLDLVNFP